MSWFRYCLPFPNDYRFIFIEVRYRNVHANAHLNIISILINFSLAHTLTFVDNYNDKRKWTATTIHNKCHCKHTQQRQSRMIYCMYSYVTKIIIIHKFTSCFILSQKQNILLHLTSFTLVRSVVDILLCHERQEEKVDKKTLSKHSKIRKIKTKRRKRRKTNKHTDFGAVFSRAHT